LSTHGSGKERDSVDEDKSEFQLLSIDGIVRAILDRRSGKGSDVIPGERSEFHPLSIEGTFRIISTIDLEKSNSVEESDVNFTHF
jgi:hypothetical protein